MDSYGERLLSQMPTTRTCSSDKEGDQKGDHWPSSVATKQEVDTEVDIGPDRQAAPPVVKVKVEPLDEMNSEEYGREMGEDVLTDVESCLLVQLNEQEPAIQNDRKLLDQKIDDDEQDCPMHLDGDYQLVNNTTEPPAAARFYDCYICGREFTKKRSCHLMKAISDETAIFSDMGGDSDAEGSGQRASTSTSSMTGQLFSSNQTYLSSNDTAMLPDMDCDSDVKDCGRPTSPSISMATRKLYSSNRTYLSMRHRPTNPTSTLACDDQSHLIAGPSSTSGCNSQKASTTSGTTVQKLSSEVVTSANITPRVAEVDDSDEDSNDSSDFDTDIENESTSNKDVSCLNTSNILWSKQSKDPLSYMRSYFRAPFGPTDVPTNFSSPLEFFFKFFTEQLLNSIVRESNLYARQKMHELNLMPKELKAFIGVLVLLGLKRLPSLRLYWSDNDNFHVEGISRVFGEKRFFEILRFLHLNDNEKMPKIGSPDFDRLYKVRPLLSGLAESFQTQFNPSRQIAIRESIYAFRGHTSLEQFIHRKKRGVKIWALCCSKTGYLLNFEVYPGKLSGAEDTQNLAKNAVLKMVSALKYSYYQLYFENSFTSVELLMDLLEMKQFACGAFSLSGKDSPKNVLKADGAMKLGESDHATFGDLSACKWQGKGRKSVCVLSTFHNAAKKINVHLRNHQKKQCDVECPKSVSDHRKFMSGVDKFDELINCHSVVQKSARWWVKLFYYFIDAAIVNSYILYRESQKQNKGLSHLMFRSTLANELVGTFMSRGEKNIRRAAVQRFRNVGSHMPEKLKSRRRCANCSTSGHQKRSDLMCKECQVALCKACFVPFHSR